MLELWFETGGRVRRSLTRLVSARSRWTWPLAFAAVVFFATEARPGGTPAGTAIRNWASVSYVDPNGLTFTAASDTAVVVVGQVAGVDVEPPRTATADPGDRVVLPHDLTNYGNGIDSFTVAALSSQGWSVRVYLDRAGNGVLDPLDPELTGPLTLAADSTAQLLIVIDIPNSPVYRGSVDSVTVQATSLFDSRMIDQVIDVIDVRDVGILVTLTKAVDLSTATEGDILTYTVHFDGAGPNNATNFTIVDAIPPGASYVPGSLSLDGAPLTDASGDDAGQFEGGSNRVAFPFGDVTGSDSGDFAFQVQVTGVPASQTSVTNLAVATYVTLAGSDSVTSNPVSTTLLRPDLFVEKYLLGPNPASIGDQVQYRIHYGNNSADAVARGVVISDSLPSELEFVSSNVPAQVSGQLVTWTAGDLAPGDTAEAILTLRVADGAFDTLSVVNEVEITAGNADDEIATAPPLQLIGLLPDQLTLDKTADLLQVGLGETVPYTLTVENSGQASLANLRIHDRLPQGAAYSKGSVSGADSVRIAGRIVTFFISGPLGPGETHSVRYTIAIVSAEDDVLTNTAYATAEGGVVRSLDAVAFVQMRRGFAMQSRAAIGEVWVDHNGDGVRGSDEEGVVGVDLVTEDGEVVSTDPDGKFSFRNLRIGRHALRLDPATLPVAYRVTETNSTGRGYALDVGGWTTPRSDFRLVPREAQLRVVRLPYVGELQADDICEPPAELVAELAGAELASQPTELGATVANCYGYLILDGVPDPDRLPAGTVVELLLEPLKIGWPEAVFPLPAPWEVQPGASEIGEAPAPEPELLLDRDGSRWLLWRFTEQGRGPIVLRVSAGGVPSESVEPVGIPPLLSAEQRSTERRANLTAGPGVEVFDPVDGTVFPSDRVFIGVRGEPGAPVALFDGNTLLAEGSVRGDGIHDFIAVKLTRGPHRIRVRMTNSRQVERWDSVAVHITGPVAGFVVPDEDLTMVADGQNLARFDVRVVDEWGVPVTNAPFVTVSAEGAQPFGLDAQKSSVGHQVATDAAGWITVPLRPGHVVGPGRLLLQAGEARADAQLLLLPAARSLLVNGIGQVGIGASPDGFAAITARGRLDDRTSLMLSFDTRQLDAGRDFFGRGYDPLEESQYQLLGDASQQRTYTASRYSFAARVERGLDWITVGDVALDEFSENLGLLTYRRAMTAAAARIGTGAVVWKGFGAFSTQRLREVQLRGAGTSGPYALGPGVRAGTEQVIVETRDRLNASNTIARQVLVRFVDYQIDYETGALLLRRPVPASDTHGNSVFLRVTYESNNVGSRQPVGGLRAEIDGRRLASSGLMSHLNLGVLGVASGETGGEHYMSGFDARFITRHATIATEVAYASVGDSSGVAVAVDGSVLLLDDAAVLSAGWLSVGSRFLNPSNAAIRGGTEEYRVGGALRVGPANLSAEHLSQNFRPEQVKRRSTNAGVSYPVTRNVEVQAGVRADRFTNRGVNSSADVGRLEVRWRPSETLAMWLEGRRLFSHSGQLVEPDQIAAGGAYQVHPGVALEVRHRRVFLPADSADYFLTDFGVRADVGLGTRAWGSYQLAGGGSGPFNAAVIGLDNQLRVGQAFWLNTMFERRVRLEQASPADPARALPFLQFEENYWSAGLGMEWLPLDAPYRLSARGEVREGDVQTSWLATLAGVVALNRSFSLLSRQDFLRNERPTAGGSELQRRRSSLWGLAFRPIGVSPINLLAKFEWVDETNPPAGGVLSRRGNEERVIGALEAIWTPAARSRLGGRYALRHTIGSLTDGTGAGRPLESWADFVGTRFNIDANRWVGFKLDGRLLLERTSGTARWDLAPSLAVYPLPELQIEGGYRLGDLRDPDFSVYGGHGWFMTFGARVTENTLSSIEDFWR